eukprot:g1247.t1
MDLEMAKVDEILAEVESKVGASDLHTAFLEVDAGEHAERMRMTTQLHSAVHKAVQHVMQEEGMHETAEARAGFFKKMFNCNRCQLTDGKQMSVKEMFANHAEKAKSIHNTILNALKQEDGKHGGDGDGKVTEDEFVAAMVFIQNQLSDKNPMNGGEWAKSGNPLMAEKGDRKFWRTADADSFKVIFQRLTVQKIGYRRGLITQCEDLDHRKPENEYKLKEVNAMAQKDCDACDGLDHCNAFLAESLIGYETCTCKPRMVTISKYTDKAVARDKKLKITPILDIKNAADEMQSELQEAREELEGADADMGIEKGYALEWMLMSPDGGNPFPNGMMTYVCNSLEPVVVDQANIAPGNEKADAEEGASDLSDAASDNAPKDLAEKDENMLGKILRKVGSFLGRLWDRMKEAFKTVLNLMKMTLRCSVCVVCNIVHEIVEFFKRMVRKFKEMGAALGESIQKVAASAGKFFDSAGTHVMALFGKGVTKKGQEGTVENGSKCGLDKDCKSAFCVSQVCKARHASDDNEYCEEDDECSKKSFCKYTGMTTKRKCAPKRKNGEKGDKKRKCESGFSDGTYCREPGTKKLGEKCSKVGDCLEGNWCDVSTFNTNVCKADKANGAECDDAFECASGYCTGKVCAIKGKQTKGQHCQKGDCDKQHFCEINTLSSNQCIPKKLTGAKCDSKKPFQCLSGECKSKKCASSRRRRRLLAITSAKRTAMRKTALRKTMMKLKQLQRLSILARAAHKIDRTFTEKNMMNADMVATLVTSIVSFMHAHTEKLKQTQHNQGLAALPNQCISEEKLGTSFAIAINVENPSLLKWASNALFSFPEPVAPIPEFLAAIMPLIANNQISDPACLADMAVKTAAQSNALAKDVKEPTGNFGGEPIDAQAQRDLASFGEGGAKL